MIVHVHSNPTPARSLVSCASGRFVVSSWFEECCPLDAAPTVSAQDAVFDLRVEYHWDALRADLAKRRGATSSERDAHGVVDDYYDEYGYDNDAVDDTTTDRRSAAGRMPEYKVELRLLLLQQPRQGDSEDACMLQPEHVLLRRVCFWLTREEIDAGRVDTVYKRRFRAEIHWRYIRALTDPAGGMYQFVLRVTPRNCVNPCCSTRLGSPFFLSAFGGTMTTLAGDANDETLKVKLSLHHAAVEGCSRHHALALTDDPECAPDADRVHFFFVSASTRELVPIEEVRRNFQVLLNGMELGAFPQDVVSATRRSVSVARAHWWDRRRKPVAPTVSESLELELRPRMRAPSATATEAKKKPGAQKRSQVSAAPSPAQAVVPCAVFSFSGEDSLLPYAGEDALAVSTGRVRVLLVGDVGLQAAVPVSSSSAAASKTKKMKKEPNVCASSAVADALKDWSAEDPAIRRLFRDTLSEGNLRMLQHFFSVLMRECPAHSVAETTEDILLRLTAFLLRVGTSGGRWCLYAAPEQDLEAQGDSPRHLRARLQKFFRKHWSFSHFQFALCDIIGRADDNEDADNALFSLRAYSDYMRGDKSLWIV